MAVAAPAATREPAAPPPPGPARRWTVWTLARLAGAVLAALALYLSFPPYGLWPLAPVGVAVLALVCHGRRIRAGFGLGMLAGLAFFIPLLGWTGLNVGAFPWLLLSSLQALFIALLGAATAWVSPVLARRPGLWPPITALLWVGQEAARDRLPFGGFPWGRLAFSQGDSPLLRFAAWPAHPQSPSPSPPAVACSRSPP